MALALVKRTLARALRIAQLRLDALTGIRHIHFIHIGKTGGTALKAALTGAPVSGARVILHRGHGVALPDIAIGDQCIFFVRDPISRFVSAFYSRQRQGRPRHNVAWTDDERKAFASFQTPNELAIAITSPDASRRLEAQHAMTKIKHIKDHYWQWFGTEAYLHERRGDILFVGSQEQLEVDIQTLSALLRVALVLPQDDVRSHRNPADVDRHLDSAAIANLVQWYRSDYEFLRLMRRWFPHLPDYGYHGGK